MTTLRANGGRDMANSSRSKTTTVSGSAVTNQKPSTEGWIEPLTNNGKKSVGGASTSPPKSPQPKSSTPSSASSKGNKNNKGLTQSPQRTAAATTSWNGGRSSKTPGQTPSSSSGGVKSTPKSPSTQPTTQTGRNGQQGEAVSTDVRDAYTDAPLEKWSCDTNTFSGSYIYDTIGKQEEIKGSPIADAIELFKSKPAKYVALYYQTDMVHWPVEEQKYTLIHRYGTRRFRPQGVDPQGWMTVWVQEYQHLPPFPNNQLPANARDAYTDHMVHHGRKIHSAQHPPIMPGRGMGVGDTPLLKIIGDIDPSDIHQGQVGDCWLLSAISGLAEFDGAVKKLFRKTKNLEQKPLPGPNEYIVTLWDLPTWKEVDIVMDERLAASPDGQLLASKPSVDGELWVCYLEKALAIHCGGWDKITGGQCSHAWALMTGCREQYTIRRNGPSGKFSCFAKYNPAEGKWAKHHNSPKDNNGDMWKVPWPKVGGGGGVEVELSEKELFLKMFEFDRHNFIVGAGTNGTSDKNMTEGMVDNHAYSVIEAVNNAADTGIDLFKVRNPWGKGEIEDGEFDDDGPGWDKYPQIKRLLNPVADDDGVFWLTRQEFFKFFDHIYVSASDMTAFLEEALE
eukprot:Nitzschia sp. Nitz4//scaffold67_size101165//82896//84994//NITZ4_004541-RA/size101165-augustus-gene-0.23-mRNA-1//-1//CDS//3329556510//471//frame0